MTNLNQSLECIIDGLGQVTGEAIKSEIGKLLAMPTVDIGALQAAVAQIQALMDTDPSTPGFQAGQSIITQLVAIGNRLDNIENSTVVASLQTLVASLESSLVSEIADREAADHILQAQIETAVSSIEALQLAVATLETAGPGGSCDCVAIAAQISSLESSLSNLIGTDTAQAVQIEALQASLSTMAASVATATAAAAAAASAASAAQSTANAAATAAAAANAAIAALSTRENDHHNEHHGRLNHHDEVISGIESINCTALVARFRANVAVGLAG